jgi:hypothetical protein
MTKTTATKEITPREINGHVYKGQYIPASEAIIIAYKLVSVMSGNGDVMPLITSKNDNLILSILSYTLRDEAAINEANFNNIYTANLGELVAALKFVVEANFGDFLLENGIGLPNVDLSKDAPQTTAL